MPDRRPPAAARRVLAALLPPTAGGRRLAAGACVDSVGTGMFLAAATVYFVGVVGLPASGVGIALSAASVVGLLTPVPAARLAARVGEQRLYVVLLALRGVGYGGYVLVHSLWAYAVLTCVLLGLDRACTPLLQIVVGEIDGSEHRTATMAAVRSMRNVGMTLGALAAGAVLAVRQAWAFDALFLANAASFGVIAVVVGTLRARGGGSASRREAAPRGRADRGPLRQPRFLALTLANAVMSLHDSVLFVLLPVWVATRTHAPAATVSLLVGVNTVLTVALQVGVTRFADSLRASRRLVLTAVGPLVSACAAFAVAERVTAVVCVGCAVVAAALLTVGENLHAAAAWDLSYRLAPEEQAGEYIAVFSMGVSGQQILGPALMTLVVLPLGAAGWAMLAGIFAVAAVTMHATAAPTPRHGGPAAEPAHAESVEPPSAAAADPSVPTMS